jgi:hypothetical protein
MSFGRGTLLAMTVAASAFAQTNAGGGHAATAVVTSMGGFAADSFFGSGPPVTGQPYSAQQEMQSIQTLADGTHITNGVHKVVFYRDSLGRTRTERTLLQPPATAGKSAPLIFTEISDPVSGNRYVFDSNSHTAHRTNVPGFPEKPPMLVRSVPLAGSVAVAPTPIVPPGDGNTERLRPERSTEQLGTQTIEGVLAEGTRTTVTYPVGFFGNDRPIATVTETWVSRELGMAVLTKTSDPRTGETTSRLTNISRAEPPASLFAPPADYEIVDNPMPVRK